MTGPSTIARLNGGGRIWALGALLGDDAALETLARAVRARWRSGDRLVVLGNMLGPHGDPARALDGLLLLRRRLMAASRGCNIVFLRGAQEEMWHKALSLQFAMTPLEVLDWMLGRGLAAIVQATAQASPMAASPAATGRRRSPAGREACAGSRQHMSAMRSS